MSLPWKPPPWLEAADQRPPPNRPLDVEMSRRRASSGRLSQIWRRQSTGGGWECREATEHERQRI
uniref:Uncharacterized protein n=1 Tax=Setaria italica TaxID=4555 RepID=K3ZPV1_SETIT